MDASICSLPTDLFTIIRNFVGPSKFKPILQTYIIPFINQITESLCPRMNVDDIGICSFDFNQFNESGQMLLTKIVILGDFYYETLTLGEYNPETFSIPHIYHTYKSTEKLHHKNAYWTMKELLLFIAYCETITRQSFPRPDRSHIWLERIYSKANSEASLFLAEDLIYLEAFFGS